MSAFVQTEEITDLSFKIYVDVLESIEFNNEKEARSEIRKMISERLSGANDFVTRAALIDAYQKLSLLNYRQIVRFRESPEELNNEKENNQEPYIDDNFFVNIVCLDAGEAFETGTSKGTFETFRNRCFFIYDGVEYCLLTSVDPETGEDDVESFFYRCVFLDDFCGYVDKVVDEDLIEELKKVVFGDEE